MTKRLYINPNVLDALCLCWWLYVCGYAYLQPVYPVRALVLHSTLLLGLYFFLRAAFSFLRVSGDLWAAMIGVAALAEMCIGFRQRLGNCHLPYPLPVTGSFPNPGPYGIFLALGLVMGLALWRKYKHAFPRPIKYLAIIFLLLLTGMLWLTWSRAALLAAVITLLNLYRAELKPYRAWLAGGLPVLAAVFYFLKPGSVIGRGIVGWVSGHSMAAHPWIGTGMGSFKHQYAQTLVSLTQGMPDGSLHNANVLDYSFNLVLYIGVEQGLVGLLFALGCTLCLLHYARSQHTTLKWCVPVLLITSLFSYPFALWPFQLIMTLTLAQLGSAVPASPPGKRTWGYVYAFMGLLFILPVMGPLYRRIGVNNDFERLQGHLSAYCIPQYYAMLPDMSDKPEFLFALGKVLQEQGRWQDSNALLRKGELVSTDPMFVVLQGNNYASMGEFSYAEAAYQRAFRMMPNRVYPLYRLMILYANTGQTQEAEAMARRVRDFPVKVKSRATAQMQEEAAQYLAQP